MRTLFTLFVSVFLTVTLAAQVPAGFNFQAVARGADNAVLAGQNVGVRISLLRGGATGAVAYSERHAVSTSDLGVFDLRIGAGDALDGKMEDIEWGSDTYYLKIDLDPDGGTDYVNMGATQLVSVPYALYAANAGGGSDDQTLSLNGTNLRIEDGNAVDLSALQDGVNDADADPANELQTLSLSSRTLSLSNGGGSVDLAPIIPADVWTPSGTNEIYYSGRVGIGVTTPESGVGLHVADDVFVQSNRGALLIGYPDNGNRWRVATQNTGEDLIFRHKGDGQNTYDTRFSFTQDGRLTVNGSETPGRLSIFQGGQAVGNGLVFDDGTANDVWHITHGFGLRFHYGNALRAAISAGNGAYIQGSDRKLKEDIAELGPVTERLLQLRPTTYKYRGAKNATTTIGFVAQEVEPVFPELVHYMDADNTYGLNYAGFGVIAVKAIQEQQAVIESQRERITDLEARLTRLEARLGE